MAYHNLSNHSIEVIVNCLCDSFSDYFVKMPEDPEFWRARFKAANANYNLSVGHSENGELVSFIIHCLDEVDGILTAYNTGTGVIESARGNRHVDKMYEHILPDLKAKNIKRCSLEVITLNERAIRVYERIGFNKTHEMFCYGGTYTTQNFTKPLEVSLISVISKDDKIYSWDNRFNCIKRQEHRFKGYEIYRDQTKIGHAILDPDSGYIAQIESTSSWDLVFDGLSQISNNLRINNVHESRSDLRQFLDHSSIEPSISQFEMEWTDF